MNQLESAISELIETASINNSKGQREASLDTQSMQVSNTKSPHSDHEETPHLQVVHKKPRNKKVLNKLGSAQEIGKNLGALKATDQTDLGKKPVLSGRVRARESDIEMLIRHEDIQINSKMRIFG